MSGDVEATCWCRAMLKCGGLLELDDFVATYTYIHTYIPIYKYPRIYCISIYAYEYRFKVKSH